MPDSITPFRHVVIAGFGLPGRFVAELLEFHAIPYRIIDLNPATAQRCPNLPIIVGDVRDESILRQAGITEASLLALTVPGDEIALEATRVARGIRPDLPILARVAYTSAGIKAQQLGAEAVVIAEQIIAREFFRIVQERLPKSEPADVSATPPHSV